MLLAVSTVLLGLTLGLSHANISALDSTPSSFNNHGGDFISLFSCPTFVPFSRSLSRPIVILLAKNRFFPPFSFFFSVFIQFRRTTHRPETMRRCVEPSKLTGAIVLSRAPAVAETVMANSPTGHPSGCDTSVKRTDVATGIT